VASRTKTQCTDTHGSRKFKDQSKSEEEEKNQVKKVTVSPRPSIL